MTGFLCYSKSDFNKNCVKYEERLRILVDKQGFSLTKPQDCSMEI